MVELAATQVPALPTEEDVGSVHPQVFPRFFVAGESTHW
jgi:hypothetical protein